MDLITHSEILHNSTCISFSFDNTVGTNEKKTNNIDIELKNSHICLDAIADCNTIQHCKKC